MVFIFQVKKIKGRVATGAINFCSFEPRHDDYFVVSGEVEFGGGYMATGHFNEAGFRRDEIIWNFQSYPDGTYKEKTVVIPKGIKIKPGQYIQVTFTGELNYNTELIFHKDRHTNFFSNNRVKVRKYKDRVKGERPLSFY